MKMEAAVEERTQGKTAQATAVAMQQLMLPLLIAVDATKNGLLAFVQQMGMLALSELLNNEAEMIAGPKGRHAHHRTHHHWGSAATTLPFGGRHVSVKRPRVRRRGPDGGEVELPSIEALRGADPMSVRVAEQIVIGVSTRGYNRSLDPVHDDLKTRERARATRAEHWLNARRESLRSSSIAASPIWISSPCSSTASRSPNTRR